MREVHERLRDAFRERIVGHASATRLLLEWAAIRLRYGPGEEPAPALVGPPGSGRAALAEALAEGLGLPLFRVELGGLAAPDLRGRMREDGGERGVIRSRLGAQPRGVVLFEGVDRLGGGRAALALRTLLERGERFVDRFRDEEVSLSESFVLVSAEHLDGIPAALREVLRVIPLRGYDTAEQVEIAERHLIPRALADLRVPPDAIVVQPDAIEVLARRYAPEAGVRGLKRWVGELIRRAAARLVLGEATHVVLGASDLEGLLGAPPSGLRLDAAGADIGVALGLCWTYRGGEVALVEALMRPESPPAGAGPGRGPAEWAGGVRAEAIESAVAYLQDQAEALGLARDRLGLHRVAVRAIAPPRSVPGARAGLDLAVLLALASVASERPVRPDVAAVGTVTLRGQVRPLPGLAEMVLGAARSGVRRVLLPRDGLAEVVGALPASTLRSVALEPVDHATEATRAALIDIVIARAIR